jgi:hypothetical protein
MKTHDSCLKLKGVWKFTIRDAKTGKIKRIQSYENLIPTAGRSKIAEALAGDLTGISEVEINKTSLGTGSTAPVNGNTTLETEVFRKDVASATFSSNKLFVTAFYTAIEVTGTFAEAGLHIDGTGAVDTGTLFSRVLISVTKSASETLTVDYTVTIT